MVILDYVRYDNATDSHLMVYDAFPAAQYYHSSESPVSTSENLRSLKTSDTLFKWKLWCSA
ncbi:hypothetical protein VCR31J2_1310023 [Vibrio coralliirubri]|uniref:Uncharacterized protein n=1 Tax=Vibrio coralliirubri TaxID=1516159 RepID=A0AA86WZ30_9VIBR|nr:hypothetical protein VCR31J2_1310023 [Vibrio coralliirubri]